MSRGPDHSKKLRDAAVLIKLAVAALDDRSSRCPCCGIMKSENLDEAHAARSLRALASKIERHADVADAARDVAENRTAAGGPPKEER